MSKARLEHDLMDSNLPHENYYNKERVNFYWQLKDLWGPNYLERRNSYNGDVFKYVDEQTSFWH